MSAVREKLDKADEALTNLPDEYEGDQPEAFEGAVEAARVCINVARSLVPEDAEKA